MTSLPLWLFAVPALAAVAIALSPRRLAEVWTHLAAAMTFLLALLLFGRLRAGEAPAATLVPLVPGLDLAFRIDTLGATFALLATGLWVLTSIYSSGYVRAERLENHRRFFAAFAVSIAATVGIALAQNVLTMLLFFEALTVATYFLVAHKETPKAIAAGRKYLVYSLGGGLALTVATAWTWTIAGTLDFTPGGFLQGRLSDGTAAPLFALFIAGVGVKAAIMPLHSWLPTAMVAPTPVSALLHAVAVVKAGAFGCLRVIGFVFGPGALQGTAAAAVLCAASGATIVFASLLALRQENLKRRLAYSTVAHLSYIVLGGALLAPAALAGGVLHLVNHGLMKITLFFCAGAIHAQTGAEEISQLRGVGRRMPWTLGAFTVGALGLAGVPGLCGFVSKLLLSRGALDAGQALYLGVMAASTVLSLAYFLPIVRAAFFEPPLKDEPPAEAPLSMRAPLVATAALAIIFGAIPVAVGAEHALAAQVARTVFGGGAR